jgi:hypothetical protein
MQERRMAAPPTWIKVSFWEATTPNPSHIDATITARMIMPVNMWRELLFIREVGGGWWDCREGALWQVSVSSHAGLDFA